MDKVEEKFQLKLNKHYGVWLFKRNDAIDCIRFCQEQNIPILGIDAFKLHSSNMIQPFMSESVNYSAEFDENIAVFEEAIAFLENASDEFMYEVVYDSDVA